jgi:hypothetical protein
MLYTRTIAVILVRLYERKVILKHAINNVKQKKNNNLIRGLEWPRGFQEVKVPRFHDNGIGWW